MDIAKQKERMRIPEKKMKKREKRKEVFGNGAPLPRPKRKVFS